MISLTRDQIGLSDEEWAEMDRRKRERKRLEALKEEASPVEMPCDDEGSVEPVTARPPEVVVVEDADTEFTKCLVPKEGDELTEEECCTLGTYLPSRDYPNPLIIKHGLKGALKITINLDAAAKDFVWSKLIRYLGEAVGNRRRFERIVGFKPHPVWRIISEPHVRDLAVAYLSGLRDGLESRYGIRAVGSFVPENQVDLLLSFLRKLPFGETGYAADDNPLIGIIEEVTELVMPDDGLMKGNKNITTTELYEQIIKLHPHLKPIDKCCLDEFYRQMKEAVDAAYAEESRVRWSDGNIYRDQKNGVKKRHRGWIGIRSRHV